MGERDERTGMGRVRANAAYVAARASRDVWPRDEKTGCVVMGDERNGAGLLREAARLMREHANATVRDGADAWYTAEILRGYGFNMDPADADFAASWHPGVAVAVADWLDAEAESWDDDEADLAYYHPYLVARAYLAAPVSAGEPKENT